ncbi:MAG: HNH endonuclease [Mesotoga sp.]|uniref:HNH endonuclease n=1 Tax=Mesotoga sp. TaxID=2053577 RepID=UPI003565EF76
MPGIGLGIITRERKTGYAVGDMGILVVYQKGEKMRDRSMENNHQWKGGKITKQTGYIKVKLAKDDPFRSMADVDGYIFEHRLVMAKHLGRLLKAGEVVHHKNHIRNDNRIENLILAESQVCHRIHFHPKTRIIKICSYCGKPNEYHQWQIERNKTGRFFCNGEHAALYQWKYLKDNNSRSEIATRNKNILDKHNNGVPSKQIARLFGLTPERINQIIRENRRS